ncbi:transcription factor/nuclear export subunit protein 2-domain-containing protein [Mycena amicta]|nr:transcription factor/nuclear export subunit protein 2-domain-containing protein [Mycena amicta]
MEVVVGTVHRHLQAWSSGGEAACRAFVIPAHSDPTALDLLFTAYHTLVLSMLSTWSPKHSLSPPAFVSFVKAVVDGLPSSSSNSSPMVAVFGEQLVDTIWSVDSELEEIVLDARNAIANAGDSPSGQLAMALARAKKAKQNAENDKEILVRVVKQLVELGIVVPSFCAERLDTAVSSSVGIITEKNAFDKKEIRTRTGLFYKQNKFNLLREQSEGYSKLTAELTSSLGPAHSSATGLPAESYAAIHERARPVWEKVISLVGYFDLDPNRALDIILDVLSVHLVTHYSFFLALLSFSPWTASYRRPTDEESNMPVDLSPGVFKGKTLDQVLSLADARPIEIQGNGPRVMAQVVGFKFAYYQSPDVAETTPKNLYLTAAILIRQGFITLEDLYPHLSPNDDNMDQLLNDYLADVQTRMTGRKPNALATAAPLSQDERPAAPATKAKAAPAPDQKKTAEPKKIPNQKVGLLAALLAVGAMKPAVSIMSKFPWFINAHPEIADLMLRILKLSIAPLYDTHLVAKERNPSFTQPRARYGTTGVALPPPRKPTLTLWAPAPPCTSTQDFIFFFPHWTERIPICSSLDDLVDVIEPLVAFVGVHISRDSLFMTKLLRLGRVHVQSTMTLDPETKRAIAEGDPEDPIRRFWFSMLRKFLLPALSLVRGNAICTVEVWNIMRYFETTSRWRLYGEWRSATYMSHPELRVRHAQVEQESSDVMKRISLKTFDALSGTVAKLAHANPCIFFRSAVSQIMSYDNLANPVVQALRYVTNMGFDVLVFIILDSLANPEKERVKPDGVNISDWLQSLASFTGMLFRRYSADLTPVLKYIVNQLHNGQTSEIVVLRELIWKMAGIEPLPSLSDNQIVCMAGGPILRIEAIASSTRGARLDPGEAVYKGPQRLGRTLLESSLAFPLLVQVAQQRDSCVYKASDAHLKSLASLFDTTHGVLLQYIELLTSSSVVAPQDYADKVIPSLGDLGELYGICAPISMHIIRPVLNAKLLATAEAMQEQEKIANAEAERRLKAALTAKKPLTSSSRMASPGVGAPVPEASAEAKPVVPQDAGQKEDVSMESAPIPESPWLPELVPLFEDVKKIAPSTAFDIVGPAFYVTFWQMSTYDIAPPVSKYEEQNKILKELSAAEDTKYNQADRSPDRSIRITAVAHRHRRDRYNQFLNSLAQEFKQQTLLRAFTIKRLAREKQHWFSHSPKPNALVGAIIEHCIQPRCLLSPMDADYCSQIIKVLHTLGTPGFHTLQCYNKASHALDIMSRCLPSQILSEQIRSVLFSCSEYEARNYGMSWNNTSFRVFLRGVLLDIYKWYGDEAQYNTDNQTITRGTVVYHPGFVQKWNSKTIQQSEQLQWDAGFKRIVRKWHTRLAKYFADCIKTGEFMRIYNSIVMLKEILPVFPLATVSAEPGTTLMQTMEKFLETEERDNLKVLGRSYHDQLKKREPLWSKPATKATPRPSSTTTSEKAKTPTAPSAVASASRASTASAPSAPRAQLASTSTPPPEKPTPTAPSTSSAFANIQRPPVVKRVREAAGSGADDAPAKSAGSRFNSPAANNAVANTAANPVKEAAQSPGVRVDGLPMPPPVAPSQTQSAQELRETAKQTMVKKDDENRPQNGSRASSPRRRSASPSTGNHSSEGRASGGRVKRTNGEASTEDKRPEHTSPLTRRDSLTHRARDRDDRDKDRRHERDRRDDRDRDRDRHRRDDTRKEIPIRSVQLPNPSPVQEDKSLPGRPDPRPRNGEDTLGKRRRPTDDDPDRGSKRTSRRDGHRDERARRPGEKEGYDRGRESDRRRRDRDGSDNDSTGDKRGPDGPSSKPLPLSTPSGPRAMSSSDLSRPGGKTEGGRDRVSASVSAPGLSNRPPSPPEGQFIPRAASLQSRLSDPRQDYRGDPGAMKRDEDRDNRKRPSPGESVQYRYAVDLYLGRWRSR